MSRVTYLIMTALGLEPTPPSWSPSISHYASHESRRILLTCFHNKPQGKEISLIFVVLFSEKFLAR